VASPGCGGGATSSTRYCRERTRTICPSEGVSTRAPEVIEGAQREHVAQGRGKGECACSNQGSSNSVRLWHRADAPRVQGGRAMGATRNPRKKKPTQATEADVTDISGYDITLLDTEVFESFPETPAIKALFDIEGRFIMPSTEQANSWRDAHRFVAMALDERDAVINGFIKNIGPPRLWNTSQIKMAKEVDDLAKAAMFMGVLGEMPTRRRWDGVTANAGLPFDFTLCMSEATSRAAEETSNGGKFPEACRVRLAYLAAKGCRGLATSEATSQLRGKPLDMEDENERVEALFRANADLRPPLFLLTLLEELADTARFLAEAGREQRKDGQRRGDGVLWKVEAVASYLRGEIKRTGDFESEQLPAGMRPRAQGSQSDKFNRLAGRINNLGDVSPEERCGAAFLASAVMYGWGTGPKKAPSFVEGLKVVEPRSQSGAEDPTQMYAGVPVLQWKPALNAALYALGHNADDLGNAAVEAAKAAVRKARTPGRR
jgi:hypothetical protein